MNNNYSQTVPKIGLGTYNMSPEEAEIMTFESIKYGYRHIDTAAVYRNEEGVAKGLNKVFNETDLIREDIFITTKLWPGGLMKLDLVKSYDGARNSFEKSMLRLGLDYLDLYLIHSPHAKEKRLDQWRALVDLKESGRVKQIGVSNWGETHINELLENDLPLPDANQIELHPWSQKPDLVKYLRSYDIDIIAYSSLVPLSTWRHKNGENSLKTEEMYKSGEDADSPFKKLALKYSVSEAQILLRWALQLDYAILPKSIKIERMRNNFDLNFTIDEEDMNLIKKLDRGDSVTWEYGDPLAVK